MTVELNEKALSMCEVMGLSPSTTKKVFKRKKAIMRDFVILCLSQ